MVMKLKTFNFQDCIKEGLIRNIPSSTDKSNASINASLRWLQESEKGLKNGMFNSSVLASYLGMFHAARAILFYDGFREKSHYCIARYLEEKYVKNKLLDNKYVNLLDHYRELRHNSQYDLSFFASKEEAKNMLDCSKEFVDQIINLLEKKKAKK